MSRVELRVANGAVSLHKTCRLAPFLHRNFRQRGPHDQHSEGPRETQSLRGGKGRSRVQLWTARHISFRMVAQAGAVATTICICPRW